MVRDRETLGVVRIAVVVNCVGSAAPPLSWMEVPLTVAFEVVDVLPRRAGDLGAGGRGGRGDGARGAGVGGRRTRDSDGTVERAGRSDDIGKLFRMVRLNVPTVFLVAGVGDSTAPRSSSSKERSRKAEDREWLESERVTGVETTR